MYNDLERKPVTYSQGHSPAGNSLFIFKLAMRQASSDKNKYLVRRNYILCLTVTNTEDPGFRGFDHHSTGIFMHTICAGTVPKHFPESSQCLRRYYQQSHVQTGH